MQFITEVSDEEEHMSTDRGTLCPYVTMQVVRAGDDLYVRSAYGPAKFAEDPLHALG